MGNVESNGGTPTHRNPAELTTMRSGHIRVQFDFQERQKARVGGGKYVSRIKPERYVRSNDQVSSIDGQGVDTLPASFSLRDEGDVHLCSASLIHSLLLLTAAHCVLGKNLIGMKAVRGGHAQDRVNGGQQGLSVRQIIFHPNFDNNSLDNDIALLRLDPAAHQYANSTARIFQTPLPNRDWPDMAILSGWDLKNRTPKGRSLVFKTYKVRIHKRHECLKLYKGDNKWNRTITNNIFCGWYVGQDSCKEIESGGMLLCGTDTTSEICGIGSWGDGCQSKIRPMVYTNVSAYRPWIEMHM